MAKGATKRAAENSNQRAEPPRKRLVQQQITPRPSSSRATPDASSSVDFDRLSAAMSENLESSVVPEQRAGRAGSSSASGNSKRQQRAPRASATTKTTTKKAKSQVKSNSCSRMYSCIGCHLSHIALQSKASAAKDAKRPTLRRATRSPDESEEEDLFGSNDSSEAEQHSKEPSTVESDDAGSAAEDSAHDDDSDQSADIDYSGTRLVSATEDWPQGGSSQHLQTHNATGCLVCIPKTFFDAAYLKPEYQSCKGFIARIGRMATRAEADRTSFFVYFHDREYAPFYLKKHPKAKKGEAHRFLQHATVS